MRLLPSTPPVTGGGGAEDDDTKPNITKPRRADAGQQHDHDVAKGEVATPNPGRGGGRMGGVKGGTAVQIVRERVMGMTREDEETRGCEGEQDGGWDRQGEGTGQSGGHHVHSHRGSRSGGSDFEVAQN